MRVSELSRASGISIPTIKYYLREGLLAPGERTAPNQARYGDAHVRRLRLIRVLADVGGLNLAAIRQVLAALGDESLSLDAVLGVAHHALDGGDAPSAVTPARAETDRWLAARRWKVSSDAPARTDLAAALQALRDLGWQVGPEAFDRYADAADAVAREEIGYVARAGAGEAAVEATVIGTVVFERALVALRRLAQERHSRRRLARRRLPDRRA